MIVYSVEIYDDDDNLIEYSLFSNQQEAKYCAMKKAIASGHADSHCQIYPMIEVREKVIN